MIMYVHIWTSQVVKNPPANAGDAGLSLGWEDPLEKEMATHFTILAWEIPWTEEPGGLQSLVSHRVGHDWATKNKKQICIYIGQKFYKMVVY